MNHITQEKFGSKDEFKHYFPNVRPLITTGSPKLQELIESVNYNMKFIVPSF